MTKGGDLTKGTDLLSISYKAAFFAKKKKLKREKEKKKPRR